MKPMTAATLPCYVVACYVLLLSLALGSMAGQPSQTVTFCTGGGGGVRDNSDNSDRSACYPGIDLGTAVVDVCTAQAGEYRGSTAPETFKAFAVVAMAATNQTTSTTTCQLFHIEFFSSNSCDPQHRVANTTLCSVGCDANAAAETKGDSDHSATSCSADFVLEGTDSAIGAYVVGPSWHVSSPSPALSSRHDDEPVVPEWVIVVILVCSLAGAVLLVLPAVVGVWLYRRRTRASYDYVPSSTNHC